MSRAPNRNTRAAAGRFTPRFFVKNSLADFDAFAFPISGGRDSTTPVRIAPRFAAMTQSASRKPSASSSRPPR